MRVTRKDRRGCVPMVFLGSQQVAYSEMSGTIMESIDVMQLKAASTLPPRQDGCLRIKDGPLIIIILMIPVPSVRLSRVFVQRVARSRHPVRSSLPVDA